MSRPRTKLPKITPALLDPASPFEAALDPVCIKTYQDLLRDGTIRQEARTPLERARGEWIGNGSALHAVSYPDQKAGLIFLDLIERTRMKLEEQRALVLFGEAGSGKSHTLRRFKRVKELQALNGAFPYVSVLVGPVTSARDLWGEILKALMPDHPALLYRATASDRCNAVFTQAHSLRTRILIIDEAHNFASVNSTQRLEIHAALKAILTHPLHPMGLVLAGLPVLYDFIKLGDEVARRADFVEIAPIRKTEDVPIDDFLDQIECQLGFPKPSALSSPESRTLLWSASCGLRGKMFDLIIRAGADAFGKRDSIALSDIKSAFRKAAREP